MPQPWTRRRRAEPGRPVGPAVRGSAAAQVERGSRSGPGREAAEARATVRARARCLGRRPAGESEPEGRAEAAARWTPRERRAAPRPGSSEQGPPAGSPGSAERARTERASRRRPVSGQAWSATDASPARRQGPRPASRSRVWLRSAARAPRAPRSRQLRAGPHPRSTRSRSPARGAALTSAGAPLNVALSTGAAQSGTPLARSPDPPPRNLKGGHFCGKSVVPLSNLGHESCVAVQRTGRIRLCMRVRRRRC